MNATKALHHVTAVAGSAQGNLDFYEGVLGQRLVKTTVNFDDPGTYHLYYGDRTGSPGTIMTFFPWRHVKRGHPGNGETGAVAYAAPIDSLSYWGERLTAAGAQLKGTTERFGEPVLVFEDPDGLSLEIVGQHAGAATSPWVEGPIPTEHVLQGFQGVTLWVRQLEPTAALLQEGLGYSLVGSDADRHRFRTGSNSVAGTIDILERPQGASGAFGAGSIHHIAFRAETDDELVAFQKSLSDIGAAVTEVKDRRYFQSIYFREPGGVLFEVATDPPGFTSDETAEALGQSLKLPPWLEGRRAEIEQRLPPLSRSEPTAVEGA